jgi:hypothetical protein
MSRQVKRSAAEANLPNDSGERTIRPLPSTLTAAAAPPQDILRPPILGTPINVTGQLRSVLLCCNRVFQEPAISRMVAGFYKDLLHENVLEQMEAIHSATSRSATRVIEVQGMPVLLHIFDYMRCFTKNRTIFLLGLEMCGLAFHHIRPNVWTLWVETAVKGATLHPDISMHIKILEVLSHLLEAGGLLFNRGWSTRLMIRFLQLGGANIVLRDMADGYKCDERTKKEFLLARREPLDVMRRAIAQVPLDQHVTLDETIQQDSQFWASTRATL